MVRQSRVFTVLIILIIFEPTGGEDLWCYECNTDLRDGHKTECNDPYTPSVNFDLVSCPRNESQHCLKSIIFYRNVLVTVRACVPSREIDGYCQYEEYFPHSSIECYFCKDYACNGQGSSYLSTNFGLFMIILTFLPNKLMLRF